MELHFDKLQLQNNFKQIIPYNKQKTFFFFFRDNPSIIMGLTERIAPWWLQHENLVPDCFSPQ